MASVIPRSLALQSGNRYMEYEAREGSWHRRVRRTSFRLVNANAFTRFDVVQSPFRDMVHIRTTYNNRFLRLVNSTGGNWFVAEADEPENDRSKWSCTLFRCVVNNNNIRFFHQSRNAEHPVAISGNENLIVVFNSSGTPPSFGIIDLLTLGIIPRHVSFIGNNDLFLKSIFIRTRNRVQFLTGNRLDPTTHFEATTLNNGDVQLRSTTFDRRLWRRSNPEWIWCDTTDANDRDTIFRPVRLHGDGNNIALLSLTNNKYCMRWTRGGQPRLIDTLTASATTVVPQANMKMQEAIRDRRIYDIKYRLSEARIFNVGPVRVVPQTVDNFSFNQTSTTTLSFSFEKMTQETFSSSHSWKISYTSTLNVTVIPIFVTGTIEMNAEYSGEVSWSEVREERETVTTSVNVPVPPRTRVVVNMIIGRGSIDVPYSYTQRDTPLDRTQPVIETFNDGIFTGLNTEVFHYDIREERLPSDNRSSNFDDEDNEVIRHYIIKPERATKAVLLPSMVEEEEAEVEVEARAEVPSKL